MARFDFVVETDPMARSVDTVSKNLVATTAAVTAMQAAVIASEKKASDKICDNVDAGFFSLIHSQITSKLAKHLTDMNAKLALLLAYAKALGNTKTRMESDYNRLRRNYLKMFKALDKSLENHIMELDRDSMNLANVRKKIITDRMVRDVSGTMCSVKDINHAEQMAVSARVKSRSSKALSKVGNKIRENNGYVEKLDSILGNVRVADRKKECVPVVYIREQSMAVQGSNVTQIVYPEELPETLKTNIDMDVMSKIERLMTIPGSPSENQEISREFYRMMNTSGIDQRVAKTMNELYARGGIR